MLYVINEKHYILVSGYYREVEVNQVIPIKGAKKIEASTVKNFSTISVDKVERKTLDAK